MKPVAIAYLFQGLEIIRAMLLHHHTEDRHILCAHVFGEIRIYTVNIRCGFYQHDVGIGQQVLYIVLYDVKAKETPVMADSVS